MKRMDFEFNIPNYQAHTVLEQVKIESMIMTLLSRVAKIEAAQTGKSVKDIKDSMGEENLKNAEKLKLEFRKRYSSNE